MSFTSMLYVGNVDSRQLRTILRMSYPIIFYRYFYIVRFKTFGDNVSFCKILMMEKHPIFVCGRGYIAEFR